MNKSNIGSSAGDQTQQENNSRASTNFVTPSVRSESIWPRRPFQTTVTTASSHDDNGRPPRRHMSYMPSNERAGAGAFRPHRDDHRDDAYGGGRRENLIDFNSPHATAPRGPTYTSGIPVFRTDQMEAQRNMTRAPDQVSWRPVSERDWNHHGPPGIMRGGRTIPQEHVFVSVSHATPWVLSADAASTNTWSRDRFPTVAQINRYHQLQRTRSSRGASHAQYRHQGQREPEGNMMASSSSGNTQALNAPLGREVQLISMSSSNGSSTGSVSCRSPPDSSARLVVGEKRLSENATAPAQSSPVNATPPDTTNKRLKPSPPAKLASSKNESPSTVPTQMDSTSAFTPQLTSLAPPQKPTKFDMLDLLCTATLEMGPLQENPSGCSCPKSRCIALYCDCFKAGRRCAPGTCSCLGCKNTVEESGIDGARTLAIRNILARNPRAFTTAGLGNPPKELSPGQVACNCIRSRCLKLYCGCFQAGNACDPKICTCISCLNTEEDAGGHRQSAIQQCLEKRPNAFQVKEREVGMGCACKNNRCVRKYCECFRTELSCTQKCCCRNCENMATEATEGNTQRLK